MSKIINTINPTKENSILYWKLSDYLLHKSDDNEEGIIFNAKSFQQRQLILFNKEEFNTGIIELVKDTSSKNGVVLDREVPYVSILGSYAGNFYSELLSRYILKLVVYTQDYNHVDINVALADGFSPDSPLFVRHKTKESEFLGTLQSLHGKGARSFKIN